MNKFEEEIMIPEINRRLKEQREEFERLIDSIEIEFPDDDGIPVDISADDFKKELKNQLRQT